MRKIFILVSMVLAVTTVMGQTKTNVKAEKKVDVYYFHGAHRCPTCNAIEKETKALLESTFKKQLEDGTIKLNVLNHEEKKNKALVEKYEIWGSSLLLIDKNGKVVNLTDLAYSKARNEAAEFKADLKAELDKLLK